MNTSKHQAFHGSAEEKATAIQRLRSHFDSGHLLGKPGLYWNPDEQEGNLPGLTAHADGDPHLYEQALGWPFALGATHEALFSAAQRLIELDEQRMQTLTADWMHPHLTEWLKLIEPGSNLTQAVTVFQRRLASALVLGLPVVGPLPPAVKAIVEQWRALLERELAGQAPEAAEWAALRKASKEASPSEAGPAAVCTLVEAAAWPGAESLVEWPSAWAAFLWEASNVGIEKELSPELATIHANANKAWKELERRAESELDSDIYEHAFDDPAVAVANEPEVKAQLDEAKIRNARPLAEWLMREFEAGIRECMSRKAPAANAAAQDRPRDDGHAIAAVPPGGFEAAVLQEKGLVLVDYWAPWCGPCMQFGPTFAALAQSYAPRIKFVKVNVDEHEDAAQSQGVRALPAVLLYENGQVVERIMALSRSRIAALLDQRIA